MLLRRSSHHVALSALLLATVFSNTTPVFSKLLLEAGWSPVGLYFLTLLVMTVLLAVHEFIALERGERWGMDRSDVLGMLLTTLTGGILSPILFFLGIEYVRASDSVIYTSLLPFFVVLFAVVFLKERFTVSTLGGGLFLVAGVAVSLWPDLLSADFTPGAYLLIASSFFGALSTILHKKFVKHRHLDSIVLVRSALCLFAVGCYMLLTEPQSFTDLVTPQNMWLVLGLPIVGFLMPYFFYYRGLRHVKAVDAGLIATTGPVVGLLLASVFLGEQITQLQLISVGLVIFGILFINVPLTRWRIVPSRPMELGPLRK